jgi:hypothetical protein
VIIFVGSAKQFSILCAAAALIFRIAGLLYLLRFEHVDNLGAYRIQSETGLLPRKQLREVGDRSIPSL